MAAKGISNLVRSLKKRMASSGSRSRNGGTLQERYTQAMVLSGVGDALGYRLGAWEFCYSGTKIYAELTQLGGLSNINVCPPNWIVSDDTVMHIATGEALMKAGRSKDKDKLIPLLAEAYQDSMNDMEDRAPGPTSMMSTARLKPREENGCRIPFNTRGGGCGAAMRAMCIGLRYPRPDDLEELIAVSVESGRLTHHHPTGYLGALAAALFTAYAVQGKPVCSWGRGLLETLPQTLEYVRSTGYCVPENEEHWGYFKEKWEEYLTLRGLMNGTSQPVFPEIFGFKERDEFVTSVSFRGWGGSSGHDAPMIAYDALLAAGNNWHELCNRAMFHAGDSDSTGVIAACWYGVLYGVEHVPKKNYQAVEYKKRLRMIGASLFTLAFPDETSSEEEFKVSDSDPLNNDKKRSQSGDEHPKHSKEAKMDQDKTDGNSSNQDQTSDNIISNDDKRQDE